MKCPVCPDATLAMMDRQGVEIDYCPQCRGVWLDRGELDKLMELAPGRQAQQGQPPARQTAAVQHPDFVDSDGYGSRAPYATHGSHGYQPRRKKSWLNEIFD